MTNLYCSACLSILNAHEELHVSDIIRITGIQNDDTLIEFFKR